MIHLQSFQYIYLIIKSKDVVKNFNRTKQNILLETGL